MAKDTAGTEPKHKKQAKAAERPISPPMREDNGQDRLALVRMLIAKWAAQLQDEKTKSGVAEFGRLLALERELSESTETVREIKITWVDPGPTESSKLE